MKTTRLRTISNIAMLAVLCVSPAYTADKTAAPKKAAPQPPAIVRGIDPLSLVADQVLITTLAPQTAPIGITATTSGAPARSSLVFRVQLLTAQGFGEARKAAQVAEEIFDQPVHIDYEIPNFKVRVGDFADRGAADDYRRTALQLGYANCWVVPVTVGITEPPSLYDSIKLPVDSVNSHVGGK
jgi:hypothetical protein